MPDSFYARRLKRAFDFVCAAAGFVVLSPLLLLLSALVSLSGGPALFRQKRIGLNFREFELLKFRTMRGGPAGAQITVGKDPRITPLGSVLRKTKLDELPQLINVLRGEMSLVGPRPEVPRYVELFRQDYKLVLTVRPGITDYAAIEYRDEEAVLACYSNPEEGYAKEILPDKIRLYKKYIAEMSFATDLKILAATFGRIFRKTGGGN